jgi:hypothetical protein
MIRVCPFQIRFTKQFALAGNQRSTVLYLTPLYIPYFRAFSLSYTSFQARTHKIIYTSAVNHIEKHYNETSNITALCIAKILKTVSKNTEAEESADLGRNCMHKTVM